MVNENDDDDDVADAAPIDLGDILPSMTLKNEKGEDIDTGSITAEKGVVLFLVPKADTRKFLGLSECSS